MVLKNYHRIIIFLLISYLYSFSILTLLVVKIGAACASGFLDTFSTQQAPGGIDLLSRSLEVCDRLLTSHASHLVATDSDRGWYPEVRRYPVDARNTASWLWFNPGTPGCSEHSWHQSWVQIHVRARVQRDGITVPSLAIIQSSGAKCCQGSSAAPYSMNYVLPHPYHSLQNDFVTLAVGLFCIKMKWLSSHQTIVSQRKVSQRCPCATYPCASFGDWYRGSSMSSTYIGFVILGLA